MSKLFASVLIVNLLLCGSMALSAGRALASQVSAAERKPLIGINLDITAKPKEASVPTYYFEAIEKCGGVPILLPPMPTADLARILPKLDGLVLIGGDDYPPSLYGENTEPTTSVMLSQRSDFDVALVKSAMAIPSLPILGICAGCQVLNISEGGSLVQDIPSHHPESKIVHGGPYDAGAGPHKHVVTFAKDSKLAKIYPCTSLSVPTSHHQCVGKVGGSLHVAAQTDDGLPEAIETSGERFVIGVQWHPERDFDKNKVLFDEFLKSAAQFMTVHAVKAAG